MYKTMAMRSDAVTLESAEMPDIDFKKIKKNHTNNATFEIKQISNLSKKGAEFLKFSPFFA